jgi:hypothetical protein
MAKFIADGIREDFGVGSLAGRVMRDAGFPKSNRAKATVVRDYVKKNVGYGNDPPLTEYIKKAKLTLCTDGDACHPWGDCFPEGTLLLRDDYELVPIEQIKVGDRIWGKDKWSTIEAVVFKGPLSLDAIEMNNGSTLHLTRDHKVYVGMCRHNRKGDCPTCMGNDRATRFERITVGDLGERDVLLQPARIDFGHGDADPDDKYIEGLYLSEGWNEGFRFAISGQDGCRKEALKREVKAICDRRGIPTYWAKKYIRINDPEWSQRLAPLGTRARFKHAATLDLQEASAAALLRGMMSDSTEASNARTGARIYSTTSHLMAVQVRVLHRMFGMSMGYAMMTPEQHGGEGQYPMWRLIQRIPKARNEKMLHVRSIDRDVLTAPCWDIQTSDHYVYLPEHDVTVSNCDDHTVAVLTMLGHLGVDVNILALDYGPGIQPHVMGVFKDDDGTWLEVDSTTDRPIGYVSSARRKTRIDPFDPKFAPQSERGKGTFVGAGKPWDALPMHGYASAIFARRDVGAGAPQLTLQPCYKFSIDVDLQGATDADLQASLPTWASSVRNLSVSSFGNSTTITGTWNGSAPFTVPTSIPVAHDFGGNTGFQTVQVLVTGGSVGALDTTGGCVPVCPTGAHWNGSSCVTCPAGTYWNGNACIHQVTFQPPPSGGAPIHTGSTYHGGTTTGGTGGTQSSTGLSTGAKVGLAVGGAALLAGGAFAAYKAGWFGRAA